MSGELFERARARLDGPSSKRPNSVRISRSEPVEQVEERRAVAAYGHAREPGRHAAGVGESRRRRSPERSRSPYAPQGPAAELLDTCSGDWPHFGPKTVPLEPTEPTRTAKNPCGCWCPQGGSNPCFHLERVASWSPRRWGRAHVEHTKDGAQPRRGPAGLCEATLGANRGREEIPEARALCGRGHWRAGAACRTIRASKPGADL